MSKLDLLRKNRRQIYTIAKQCNISNIRVFGSVARNEEKKNSDIDLLVDVDFKKYGSGFARVDFKEKLEKFLGNKVDVLTEKSLSPYLKEQILSEAQKL